MNIDAALLHAYVSCKYKAALLRQGERGTLSEYETWRMESHARFAPLATHALIMRLRPSFTLQKSDLTLPDLQKGYPLLLDATVQDEQFAFHYDALRRVDGRSSLGNFYYVPILFHDDDKPREKERLSLAFGAFVLARVQGYRTTNGIAITSRPCKISNLQLGKLSSKVDETVNGLLGLVNGGGKPLLTLKRHCTICQFCDRCNAEAHATNDLSLLRGMSETEKTKNNRKGIFTVEQLSYTFRPRKRNKNDARRWTPYYHSLQALAIREQKTYVLNKPTVPTSTTHAYIDMEGNANARSIYLIGMVTVQGGEMTTHSFWADDVQEEPKIFAKLFKTLARLTDVHLYYYGSYESRALKRMLPLATVMKVSKLVTENSHNVLRSIYANIYFPTYSNSLKDVGRCLGCVWTHPNSSGLQSIVWRKRWEETRDPALKNVLIQYNLEDCVALRTVTDCVRAIGDGEQPGPCEVAFATDVQNASDYRRFRDPTYAVDAFQVMARCAYFDYQRSKIYYRTNKKLTRAARTLRDGEHAKRKPNKVVECRARKCPYCRSSDISREPEPSRSQITLDLRVSRTGIKRWVTDWRAADHRCKSCGRSFRPINFRKQKRIGHTLMAWGVHQYICNRMTLGNLALTVRECFGLDMSESHFQDIKEAAGNIYRTTYDRILKSILGGSLIHADETGAPLRSHINGYVWVLANMESVAYFYRPTRKGDFLHELLARFQGVLVTDFYTAYDSLECLQQKCLVHLMRDLNEDLFKHPFDEELRHIGVQFGELMRPVIQTIDRFGLKKRYLSKFKGMARKFVQKLDKGSWNSEKARQYVRRFVKYECKLFQFMRHDGVPWNNNNAEHAIKPFAKYRRLVKGRITERGLTDYLVLLSIYQTCKYRGISFLNFLRSKSRDIDKYCDGR